MDTLKNKTTVYNSIKETGKSINCTEVAIRNALDKFKAKGIPRLLKRRYLVSLFKDNSTDLVSEACLTEKTTENLDRA